MSSLGTFLNESDTDSGSGEVKDQPTETSTGESKETQETKETKETSTESTSDDQKTVPLAEHIKLRESRREAREKTTELEKQVAFLQGQQSGTETEEDQQALNDAFLESPREHAKRIAQEEAWNTRVSLSQDLMRDQHKDYDEVEARFRKLIANDPGLQAQLGKAANPARFAYNTVKRLEGPNESAEEMETRIRKEVTTKMEEDAKTKKADSAADSFDGTQADASGAGGSVKGPVTDLSDILPTKEFNDSD